MLSESEDTKPVSQKGSTHLLLWVIAGSIVIGLLAGLVEQIPYVRTVAARDGIVLYKRLDTKKRISLTAMQDPTQMVIASRLRESLPTSPIPQLETQWASQIIQGTISAAARKFRENGELIDVPQFSHVRIQNGHQDAEGTTVKKITVLDGSAAGAEGYTYAKSDYFRKVRDTDEAEKQAALKQRALEEQRRLDEEARLEKESQLRIARRQKEEDERRRREAEESHRAALKREAEEVKRRKLQEEQTAERIRSDAHGIPGALAFVKASLESKAGHTIDEFLKMRAWDDPEVVRKAIEDALKKAEDQYVAQYPDNPNAREEFARLRQEDKLRRYRQAEKDPEFIKMKEGKPFHDGYRNLSFWMPLEYSARFWTKEQSANEANPQTTSIAQNPVPPKATVQPSALTEASITKTSIVEKQQSFDPSDWEWGDVLRIVEDPDGNTNIRDGQSTTSSIVGYASSGSVVAINPKSKGAWMSLISGKDMGDAKFYIHSSRLREITGWTQHVIESIKPAPSSARIKLPDVEVLVQTKPFDPASHKVYKLPDGTFLVDGIKPWGVDGGIPDSAFSLQVRFDDKEIRLHDSAYSDLFQANPDTLSIIRSPNDKSHFLVLMANSDAAGAYYVIWAFKGGQYVGRSVIEGYAQEIN